MGAGQGNPLTVQVELWLHYIQKREHGEKLHIKYGKTQMDSFLLLLNLSNITYMTRVNANTNTYTYSDSVGEIGELANVDE